MRDVLSETLSNMDGISCSKPPIHLNYYRLVYFSDISYDAFNGDYDDDGYFEFQEIDVEK
jgi:hypothetical protein